MSLTGLLGAITAVLAYLGVVVGALALLRARSSLSLEEFESWAEAHTGTHEALRRQMGEHGPAGEILADHGERLDKLRTELDALDGRVKILPAHMARAARGERFDGEDGDGDGSADAVDWEARFRNGTPEPDPAPPESIEMRVFRMKHGG